MHKMLAYVKKKQYLCGRNWIFYMRKRFLHTQNGTKANMKLQKDNIEAVLAEMTIREKATIIVGAGWGSLFEGFHLPFCNGHRVPGAAGETRAIERLGIPSIVLADGPAGLRIKQTGATAFPSAVSLASSGDAKLVEEVGKAIGEEARAFGVDVLLGPGMNLMRNPLCGRNFEYYSEDATLSSDMAAAMIRGIQSAGVAATPKHYALNNQETNRFHNNVIIDEKPMRSLYLENFRRAITEAKPWALMASYNSVNGTPVQQNKQLLTDILRGEFGYEGVVLTDWQKHKNPAEKIAAGVDLLMPGSNSNIRSICSAVRSGKLSETRLNEAARRVLELIVKVSASKEQSTFSSSDHAALSRRAAAAGCVLLKNENNALPISPDVKKVGLMGVHSYNTICGGVGSGFVNCDHRVSLYEAFKSKGCKLNARAEETYTNVLAKKSNLHKPEGLGRFSKYMSEPVYNEFILFSEDSVHNVLELSEAIIVTIGRQAGEGVDVKPEKGSFYLSNHELELVNSVSRRCQVKDKKLIVVLNVAHVIETASWSHLADAILLVWLPGQEAGYAIMDVLTGVVKPAGKLPVTWPVRYEDIPSAANFPALTKDKQPEKTPEGIKDVDFTRYAEGDQIGHYYFDQHPEIPVAFPFGFGLTY